MMAHEDHKDFSWVECYLETQRYKPNDVDIYLSVLKEKELLEQKEEYTTFNNFGGSKENKGKIPLHLVPPAVERCIGRVRAFGAQKYEPDNWRKIPKEELIAAARRHLNLYQEDPKSIADDSGLLHIEHCLCNIAFLATLESEEAYKDKPMAISLREFMDEELEVAR